MPSYVRAGIRKCARIRALSAHTAGTFQTGATIYNRYFNLTVVVE